MFVITLNLLWLGNTILATLFSIVHSIISENVIKIVLEFDEETSVYFCTYDAKTNISQDFCLASRYTVEIH